MKTEPTHPESEWCSEDWESRRASNHVGAWEVDPTLPLRLFYGLEASGRLTFGYVATGRPGNLPLSSVVQVHRRQRELDDKWTLALTLTSSESELVFRQLSEHIYQRVRATSSEAQGVTAFVNSVSDWKALFAGPNRMSLAELRGLFAEIYVGYIKCAEFMSDSAVVKAWGGPLMADQDYQFSKFAIEVKSVHPTSRAIDIASEFQLEGEGIFLAVVTVIDERASFENSMTLPELVESIRNRFQGESLLAEMFNETFSQHKIDLNDPFYEEIYFSCVGIRILEVSGDFPRITSAMLPPGVNRVNYKIQLGEIAAYERVLDDVVSANAHEGDGTWN